MSLDKSADLVPRALLTRIYKAQTENDPKLLENVFQSISEAPRQTISYQLPLMLSEVAVELGQFDTAAQALEFYHRYDPPSNQFLIRAMLVKAHILHAQALKQKLKGSLLVSAVKAAIACCLGALEKIAAAPANVNYSFLVHNTSVVYSLVSRSLLKDGTRAELVDSLQTVTQALKQINPSQRTPEDSSWLAELFIELGICLDEAGNMDAAVKALSDAIECLNTQTVEPNRRMRIAKLLTYFTRGQAKAAEIGSKTIPAEWTASSASKAMLCVQRALSAAAQGKLPPDIPPLIDALSNELAGLKNGTIKPGAPAATAGAGGKPAPAGKNAAAKAGAASPEVSVARVDTEAEKKQLLGAYAEIGDAASQIARVCVSYGEEELARKAIALVSSIKFPGLHRAPVLASYTKAQLCLLPAAKAEESDGDIVHGEHTSGDLKRRMHAVKILEEALPSAIRLNDVELIEEGSVLCWNVCLPLLQPELRYHAERVLKLCAQALKTVDSSMVQLRSLLHLEIAKCEAASDFLSKASQNIEDASLLDTTIPVKDLPSGVRELPLFSTKSDPKDSVAGGKSKK